MEMKLKTAIFSGWSEASVIAAFKSCARDPAATKWFEKVAEVLADASVGLSAIGRLTDAAMEAQMENYIQEGVMPPLLKWDTWKNIFLADFMENYPEVFYSEVVKPMVDARKLEIVRFSQGEKTQTKKHNSMMASSSIMNDALMGQGKLTQSNVDTTFHYKSAEGFGKWQKTYADKVNEIVKQKCQTTWLDKKLIEIKNFFFKPEDLESKTKGARASRRAKPKKK
jgi:hypothetical protein